MKSARALSERFDRAATFAHALHAHQVRKSSPTPYLSHLLGVAALVLEYGGGEDEAIAALLHDGPEDQGGEPTLARIRRRFGTRVAEIVAGCTEPAKSVPWRARKARHLRRLQTAGPSILLVKGADSLHNVDSIRRAILASDERAWNLFGASKRSVLGYHRFIARLLCAREAPRLRSLGHELTRAVTALARAKGTPGRRAA